jgi:hypothetical protein
MPLAGLWVAVMATNFVTDQVAEVGDWVASVAPPHRLGLALGLG